jgi:uncharacterized membrane protein YfcA
MAMADPAYLYAPVIGLLVGGLIAATGVGGGTMLLPLLVAGLHIHPIVAVGSGVIIQFFTKLWATIFNWKRENLDHRLTLALLPGSVPGALIGIGLLKALRHFYEGHGVNQFLRFAVGVLLVVIPVLMLVLDRIKAHIAAPSTPKLSSAQDRSSKAPMIGLLGGFLVGLTSIGSGSMIILLLFLFYRRPAGVMVGTDVFHAVILFAMLGLVHLHMGTVDLRLVGLLLAGAVVGVPLGAKLASLIPSLWLRRAVLLMLIPLGIKLL